MFIFYFCIFQAFPVTFTAEAGACGKCADDEECVQMKVARCMKSEKIMKK